MDIKEFWTINIEGISLACAKDFPQIGMINRLRVIPLNINMDFYFNSGVLLMNLKKIRERGSLHKIAIEHIWEKRNMIFMPDQDVLNSIFSGDTKIISNKFNKILDGKFYPRVFMSDCIIHLCSSKPWLNITGMYSDCLYWKMFIRSAWGENMTNNELIEMFNDIANSNSGMPSMQCIKRIGIKRIVKAILRRIKLPFILTKYFLLAVFYKIGSLSQK